MGKRLYFGSNLKMYKTISQTLDYLKELTERTKDISRDEITLFIIPSYTSLKEIFPDAGEQIPCLYGGSVNPGNARELISQKSVDGLFVGRSAWQADKFDALIRDAMDAARSAEK